MATLEVSARIGASIVRAAATRGVPEAALVQATGFDPAAANDPDARISIALEERLWAEAAARSGDDAFGIHAAESALTPGAFGVMDYAIRTAPTVGAALARLARYNRLEHDVAVFTIAERDDVARIEHAFRVGGLVQGRHGAEFTIASIVVAIAQLSDAPCRGRAVEFRHDAPASTAEHLRVFGVSPRFSAPVNALEVDRAVLDRPVVAADPALWRVIERHAEALLAARPDPAESAAERVRRLLAQTLADGQASLATVAARLRMSERSLQRRLASEGVSFDALLDEVRLDLARRYLGDSRLAIAEVAYLLGYSEPSAFHRAFRRWTGTTPREARHGAA